uniref:NADH-ubiquinone oxidoreductase chain 6 n=1 Tax=Diphylla ecaudata TaxID=148089 RepID=A0A3G1FHY5_DIPEC|nr:NADH dehydrogenase subunit 6 [Diphylla ecaudata]AOS49754.1 NADH dehydrogenase subunit 6 [Diphylla ecaudata]
MVYTMFILSVIFVMGFVGVSSKPSPVYGGMGLIVAGSVGCGMVVCSGGSFLGLVVFLIYLGGMLVVFGYTAAMAMEQYPEVWVSNKVLFGSFVAGVLLEGALVVVMLEGGWLMVDTGFDGLGDWVNYGVGDLGVVGEEVEGVGSLYSYGVWLVVIAGWALFIAVVVIMEITRGG